jgi:hypothetical protein
MARRIRIPGAESGSSRVSGARAEDEANPHQSCKDTQRIRKLIDDANASSTDREGDF